MISETEVGYITGLARLQLSEKEQKKFQKELSLVLDYVAQLKELDVENVAPTTSGSGTSNVMRGDQPQQSDTEQVRKMLEQAPDTKDDFLKVKAILNK